MTSFSQAVSKNNKFYLQGTVKDDKIPIFLLSTKIQWYSGFYPNPKVKMEFGKHSAVSPSMRHHITQSIMNRDRHSKLYRLCLGS